MMISGCADYGAIELRIEKIMKEKGISSYRLNKMGFPLSNYYAIKRGENISTHTLNNLCKLLHCRVEDVLEYLDEE